MALCNRHSTLELPYWPLHQVKLAPHKGMLDKRQSSIKVQKSLHGLMAEALPVFS